MFTVAFAELVARQSGVVSVAQAVATGVPQRTVQRWTRTWRRLHPGVYLVAGHRLTPEGRLRAALLWAGPDAVLTGQAAAYWLGLPAPTPTTVQVTVPVLRKPRAQPRVEVRRSELHRVDLSVVRGLRVAAPPLAALETAVVLEEGSVFLDRVLQRHVRFPFGVYTIDVAIPEAKVAIEVDGWAWHVDADRFRSDRRKGNALVRAGWTLLRFT